MGLREMMIGIEEDPGARIEREFIEQLNAYYAHPDSSFYDEEIERAFWEQKLRHVRFKSYPNDGLVTFGASQVDKCDREIYFKYSRAPKVKRHDIPFRGRQRRQGTAIVDYLQLDLVHMPVRLGDVKFTVAKTKTGEWAFEDAAQHRRVFTVPLDGEKIKFAVTAKPDGILEYEGRRLLLEFKTKATGIKQMNQKLSYTGPEYHHRAQVIAESLVFGIREALILYESTQKPSWFSDEENRVPKYQKTWENGEPIADIRVFYIRIDPEEQRELLEHLARQAKLVYDKTLPDVTVDMTQKCGFCPYFGAHCHKMLTKENYDALKLAERRFATSTAAGFYAHRQLQAYLAEVPGNGEPEN